MSTRIILSMCLVFVLGMAALVFNPGCAPVRPVIADPPIITSGDSGPPWSGPGVGNGVRHVGGGVAGR